MIKSLIKECYKNIPNFSKEDEHLVSKAYNFAKMAHEGQLRKSGEPYIIHPVEAAKIITIIKAPAVLVASTLLHDVPEDTEYKVEDIRNEFGNEIAELTSAMEKLGTVKYRGEERQVENMRKLFLAFAKDIRVVLIKLADRLHNMRTLQYVRPDKQHRIARETLEIYVPLADRLNIKYFKLALEKECFRIIFPEEFKKLKKELNIRKNNDNNLLKNLEDKIKEITKEYNLILQHRIKSAYSIFKKIKEKNKTIDEIYDYYGCRIIVKDIKECYEVLDVIRREFKEVEGRFKDYIHNPKINGYKSIHITIIYNKKPVEIQIRTEEMHKESENGVSAHWNYAESKKSNLITEDQHIWIKQLANFHSDTHNFFDTLRNDFFADRIFVYTPKGDVKDLPSGSTSIDLAYAIHSEVGNKCCGCKINGKMLPLKTVLKNGDTVEIQTKENNNPTIEWLNHTKTHHAQNKIRFWLREKNRDLLKEEGEKQLKTYIRSQSQNDQIVYNKDLQQKAMENLSFSSWDHILSGIGEGIITPIKVFKAYELESKELTEIKKRPLINKNNNKILNTNHIKIEGIKGLGSRLCGNCQPQSGDPLVGYITNFRGITIHRIDCKSIENTDGKRLLDAIEIDD